MRTPPFVLALLALLWPAGAAPAQPPVAVTIDATQRRQTVIGFGTSVNSWKDWSQVLVRRDRYARQYVDEVGCTILRVNLWPYDMAPREDPAAIRFEDWRPDARAEVYLGFAARLHEVSPGVKIVATVWSPPGWMKENRDSRGGAIRAITADEYSDKGRPIDNRVRPDRFEHFAAWVVEYAKLYRQRGAPLYALSIGNEVRFSQKFESCVWTAADYATALGLVAVKLEAAGLGDIKLFGPETMTGHNAPNDNPRYLAAIMAHPDAGPRLDAWATHGYVDGVVRDTTVGPLAAFRKLIEPTGKPLWITEFGSGPHPWPKPLGDLALILHNSLVHGDAEVVLPWLFSEDSPDNGSALLVYDRPTKKTRVAQHYFRFIRPGAARVPTSATDPPALPVRIAAFVHDEQRTLAAVLFNNTDAPATLQLSWRGVRVTAPLEQVRTSEAEDFATLDPLPVEGDAAMLTLPPRSIVSVRGAWAP